MERGFRLTCATQLCKNKLIRTIEYQSFNQQTLSVGRRVGLCLCSLSLIPGESTIPEEQLDRFRDLCAYVVPILEKKYYMSLKLEYPYLRIMHTANLEYVQ